MLVTPELDNFGSLASRFEFFRQIEVTEEKVVVESTTKEDP